MTYTVKAVSRLAGVSVRTLHHYDQIGLLKPAGVSRAGYRLYSEADLEQLQQILFFKELGFELKEIKRIVGDASFDRARALVDHRKVLVERQERVTRLIKSLDRTIQAMKRGKPMKREMFDGFDATRFEEEARERWGRTPAWEESAQRWNGYGPADWTAIQHEGGEIIEGLVARMDRRADDPEVQELVRRHHRMINDRFFNCPPEVYRQIGEGYVEDPRFTAFYDRFKPGLAKFKRDAIRAYCDSMPINKVARP